MLEFICAAIDAINLFITIVINLLFSFLGFNLVLFFITEFSI